MEIEELQSEIWEWIVEKLLSDNEITLPVLNAMIMKVSHISLSLQEKMAVRYLEELLSHQEMDPSVLSLITTFISSQIPDAHEILLSISTEAALRHVRNNYDLQDWEGFEESLNILFPEGNLLPEYLERKKELEDVMKEKKCQSVLQKYPFEALKHDLKQFVEKKKTYHNECFLDKMAKNMFDKEQLYKDHTFSPGCKSQEKQDELKWKRSDSNQNTSVISNGCGVETLDPDDVQTGSDSDDCCTSDDFPEVDVLLNGEAFKERSCLKCRGQRKLSKCPGCSLPMHKKCMQLCSNASSAVCPVCTYKAAVSAYYKAKKGAVESKKKLLACTKNDKPQDCAVGTHADSEKSVDELVEQNLNNGDHTKSCADSFDRSTEEEKERMRGSVHRPGAKRNPININDLPPTGQAFRSIRRIPWTKEEEETLKKGYELYLDGYETRPWSKILEYGRHIFNNKRTAKDLQVKWRYIKKLWVWRMFFGGVDLLFRLVVQLTRSAISS